jgi:hypothetical protein
MKYAHHGGYLARHHAPKTCKECGRIMRPPTTLGKARNSGAVCPHCKEKARLARRAAEAGDGGRP